MRLRRLFAVAWRVPLVVAVAAMLVAAAVTVVGKDELADVIVTGGFAVGVLAVPLWLLAAIWKEA